MKLKQVVLIFALISVMPASAINGGFQYYVSGSDFQVDTTCVQGDITYIGSFMKNGDALSYVQGSTDFGSDFSVQQEGVALLGDSAQSFAATQSMFDSDEEVNVETKVTGSEAVAKFSGTVSMANSKFSSTIDAKLVDINNIMKPATQSGTTQSGTTQSGTTQSGTTQSGTTQSETAQSETAQSGTAQSAPAKESGFTSNNQPNYMPQYKFVTIEQTGYGKDTYNPPSFIAQKASIFNEGQISMKLSFQLTPALKVIPCPVPLTNLIKTISNMA
jgi:hypothetical protein